MKLANKAIVLTGGSSGVGLALLAKLACNNQVVALSRRVPDPSALPDGLTFTHIATDLSDKSAVASAIAQIVERHPKGIDGLINCAAVQITPRFTDANFDPASIAREIAINLASPIELVAGLLGSLRQRPQAFILNVNTGLAIAPKNGSAVYCASKAGLDNFTRGLRAQLAETQVRVQQAFLPLVETPMTEGRGSGKLTPDAVADQIIAQIESDTLDRDIGKVRLLRFINRLSPALSGRIMQKVG